MNKTMFIVAIFFTLSLLSLSNASSLQNWLTGTNITYTANNYNFTTITNVLFNGTYNIYTPRQYYLNTTIYNNTSTPVKYFTSETAYPFNFIKNMYNDKVSYCVNPSFANESNATQVFFSNLCYSYKGTLNNTISNISKGNSSAIKQNVENLALTYFPIDNFTKQLYTIYVDYSKACQNPESTVSNSSGFLVKTYCEGSSSNYSFPNPVQYNSYYQSLEQYEEYQTVYNSSQITKLMINYDVNNGTIFPVFKNSKLIQPNIAILGVYPAILPSGTAAYNMSQNNTFILPIKMVNRSLTNNQTSTAPITFTSGIYNNVTLAVAAQTLLNNYAVYNLSTNQQPFNGTESSGYETYYNSCFTNNPGISSVQNSEINNLQKSAIQNIYSDNLYPINQFNFISTPSTYHNSGPSIISATYSNLNISNGKIYYGTKTKDGNIIYEANTSTPVFSTNTNLYYFKLPLSAFPYLNETIFAYLKEPFSYLMNYYTFSEQFAQPKYSYNNYNYTIQKSKQVKVDNATKTVFYTVTCYVGQVSTAETHYAVKQEKASESYNENPNESSTLNVSTNMTTMNIFSTKNNTLSLNYSLGFKDVKYPNDTYSTETKLTVPLGTSFQLEAPNGTIIYDFNSYVFNENLTENQYKSYYTSDSKYVYSYDPAFVYPDIYPTVSVLYPTIENSYNNGIYLEQFQGEEFREAESDYLILAGIGTYFEETISSLTGSMKHNFAASIVYNNLDEYDYYKSGCPETEVGDTCLVKNSFYNFGSNPDSQAQTYDLLNPTIYTQGAYYAGFETPSWLCLKGNFFSSNFFGLLGCAVFPKSTVKQMFIDTDVLNFNTTFFGLNQTYKKQFYSNITTGDSATKISNYTTVYSYVQEPSNINPLYFLNVTKNVQYNDNGTMTLTLSIPVSPLIFDECEYGLCFQKTLEPTNETINSYFDYAHINESSYLFYLQPVSLYNFYNNSSIPIAITYGNKTFYADTGRQFIIHYNSGNTTKMMSSSVYYNNVQTTFIELYSNESYLNLLTNPQSVNIRVNPYKIQENTSTYIGLKQNFKLVFTTVYYNTLFIFSMAFVILTLVFYIGRFNKWIVYIKNKIKKVLDLLN